MVRLPRDRSRILQRQLIAYRRLALHRRSIAGQRLLPRRSRRLLNSGEPIPRDQSRILHRPLIARRRLPMNRPIRGRGRHMTQCQARVTCRARPPRLVPVRASRFLANLGVTIRSILHFHRKSVRSLDGHKSCLRNFGARKSSIARPSPLARSSSTRRIRISISCSATARHCATALAWAARGFTWSGTERISRLAKWPDWNPPAEMIERQPYLPRFMAGGEGNPLGARALYLGNTIYRIHGTNQPSTIGTFVSSGCIRLTNDDIVDLHGRVQVGTRVVVLPGRPPATASAAPVTVSGGALLAPGKPPALIGHLAPPAPLAPPGR